MADRGLTRSRLGLLGFATQRLRLLGWPMPLGMRGDQHAPMRDLHQPILDRHLKSWAELIPTGGRKPDDALYQPFSATS